MQHNDGTVAEMSFRQLFEAIESALIRIGTDRGILDFRQQLDEYKPVANQRFQDADYYRKTVHISFYSGFKGGNG